MARITGLGHGQIECNQRLLISGFRRLTEDVSGLIVLDGHMIVDTTSGLLEIALEVFAALEIDALVVLVAQPEEIANQRLKDSARKRPQRSANELLGHQELTIQRAEQVSSVLNVPMEIINADQIHRIERLVANSNGECKSI